MSAQTTLGVILVKVIRTDVINSETCVQVRRPSAASDGRVDLQVLFGEFTASHHGIDVEGVANGETNIQCQQASLRGGPASTDYAFTTRPKSARFDISVSENALEGNVAILGSVDTTRIWAHNNRFRNGSFAIDNDGATGVPDLQQNTFESCPFSVAQSSTTPFVVVQSEFVRSPISCASTAGSVILDRCYRGSSPLSGSVSDQNPAGARWLGFASVTPATPLIGAYVDLQLDYPPDMLGAWLIGTSVSHPNTGTYPFRYYFSTTSFFGVPGPFALRDRARLAIPADSSLKGIEFFAQPVAVPTTLKSWQWPITLPPGGRFLVQ